MTRKIKPCKIEMDRHPESGIGVMSTERGILPLRSLDVRAQIYGLGSKTIVRQTFQNQFDEPIEATYIFPLPGRDAVTKFVMHVNGRTIDGELQERGQARETYDQAMRDGHAAAIAEEERSETFTMRVGNIPPGEEIVIEMTLVGQLPIAGDEATFRFPLVVSQRYISGIALDGKSVGDGTACDTNSVPDASRVTPPVLIPGMPNPVELSIEVDIHAPESFDRDELVNHLSSSLHSVIVNDLGVEDGLPLKVRVQPGEKLNRDFILRFPFLANKDSCSLLRASGESGTSVFSVNIVPPEFLSQVQTPRDVVFVLDRSGSMGGWKMVAARRAVGRMIDSLRDIDRFSVMAFDNSIDYPKLARHKFVSGTDRNRWDVVQWAGTIEARGGTELEKAIATSIQLHEKNGRSECQPVIVLITDGQVGAEDATLKTIKAYSGNATPTFFCLGIDKAVNHGLLTRIAKLTGGTCETVESEVQLDKVMDRFHCEIGSPVLSDVKIKAGETQLTELTPSKTINVFPQRPISIFGIANNKPDDLEVTVSAKLPDGSTWKSTVAAQTADAETLNALWGRELLRDLEDQYVIKASKKLEKQIVKVSLQANVLSRFTAYVAVDRSRVVNEEGVAQKVVQPVEQVESSNALDQSTNLFGSIFGRLSATSKSAKPTRSISMARRKAKFENALRKSVDSFDLSALEDSCGMADMDDIQPPSGYASANVSLGELNADLSGESCDGLLQEFTDTAIDFTETIDDSDDSRFTRLARMMEQEASEHNASAIVIQQIDGKADYRFMINGELHLQDQFKADIMPEFFSHIVGLVGLTAMETNMAQIGYWKGASGNRWRVMTFRASDGNLFVLITDMDRSAALSVSAINDPVEVKQMLKHYPWLRSILDSICNIANQISDNAEDQEKRESMIDESEQWFSMLEEVSVNLSISQANVIKRMIESFRAAILNFAPGEVLDSIDVLNDMIEVAKMAIEEEERKAFWT